WGADDQIGTLNLIGPQELAGAMALGPKGKVIPLGAPIHADGLWDANTFRRNPIHVFTVNGGDWDGIGEALADWPDAPTSDKAIFGATAASSTRFADDVVIMGLQTSTQWDALSHAWYDGLLYNGVPANRVTTRGSTHADITQILQKGVAGR